ncbi:MAG: HNH endonuclease signature motif containing protein [Chlorobiaceae bacterium]
MMSHNRPKIPSDIARDVLRESGHRCAVCGESCPLERAHIIPWHKSKEHCAADLLCLCENCHQRADKENWGEISLRIYKERPWILRKADDALDAEQRSVVTFRVEFPFSPQDKTLIRLLPFSLAGILGISSDSVEILAIENGSIIITAAIPESVEPILLDSIPTLTIHIVAYYIYLYRQKFRRKGDVSDDYQKAVYLVDLVNYLKLKSPHLIHLRQYDEMESIINTVNNIFDSAYFRKINHPEYSYEQCFLEAEREFCEEKEIDYLEYLIKDRVAAERFHANKEIEALAYQQYQYRMKLGGPGDDKSDWAEAEQQYLKWRMTKRIATICWNLSSDKFKHQDYYWALACDVIRILESEGLNNPLVDLYEPTIYNTIVEVCQRQ